MDYHSKWGIMVILIFTIACSSRQNLHSSAQHEDPTEKAKLFNYNANQANYVVNYNVKHKKLRQRIANQNRKTIQEHLNKLNHSRTHYDSKQDEGAFHMYRNN